MEQNFKEYVKLVKKVYDLSNISGDGYEPLLEWINANSELEKLTEFYLDEFEMKEDRND